MIETGNSFFILLISGVALFLYGMSLASQSLEKILAHRISALLNKLSQNQFLAIVVGVSLTTVMQSSGAVTSMLVGLGSARVINLKQVMGVIIGSAIGSTLTVQLISFNIASYALPAFSIAFFVYFLNKKQAIRNIALVVMGFSFLFLGLKMISQSSTHFAENPLLKDFFKSLNENPGYSLLVSMIFCGIVQSSAVTVGLAMSLLSAGAIDLFDAMIWVYGANIGTTSTALLAAAGGNSVSKQVAWAHFFYKTLSVLIFYPFTDFFLKCLQYFDAGHSRLVANGHLVFNLLSAVIFFPFINKGSQLMEKMLPQHASEQFGTDFINTNSYESSAIAISYAQREIQRTADIVLTMIKDSLRLFSQLDSGLVESLRDRDNKVDFLFREVKMFLVNQTNQGGQITNQKIMNMVMFLSDLERAADSIDINIIALAIKKNALKLEFSNEGRDEIRMMHEDLIKLATLASNSFQNKELSKQAVGLKREFVKKEIVYRENHLNRLSRGMRDSINTSSIHLDLLSEYRRIASLLCNHAYTQTGIRKQST